MMSVGRSERLRRWPGDARVASLALALTACSACAPRAGVVLPTSQTGSPDDRVVAEAHAARAACGALTSFSAEIAVSGRVGRDRVRGRLLAGFADGGRTRLEALAPFGQPVFIFVSSGDRGTVLLPRARQVVTDVAATELLAALTGIAVDGGDLAALLSGCVVHGGAASAGRQLSDGWSSVSLADGRATAYLRSTPSPSAPRLAGAQLVSAADPRAALSVGYERFGADGLPRRVWLERKAGGEALALDLTLSQVDTTTALEESVFRVIVPPEFTSVPLEQLRRTAPLAQGQ